MSRVRPTIIPDESVCRSTLAAMSLLHVMKSISVERFSSPWAAHLDRRLWREAHNPQTISKMDGMCLQYLSKLSHGWWSWGKDDNPGPTFVPLEAWVGSLHD